MCTVIFSPICDMNVYTQELYYCMDYTILLGANFSFSNVLSKFEIEKKVSLMDDRMLTSSDCVRHLSFEKINTLRYIP